MLKVTLTSEIQQSEQLNGFWLISFTLEESIEPCLLVGIDCFFENENIALRLFQQTDNRYHFLSLQPFSEEFCLQPTQLYVETQAHLPFPKADQPVLLLGDGLAMANVFAVAKELTQNHNTDQQVCKAFLHSKTGFPFMVKPARFLMEQTPAEAIGSSTLLEDWKIPNRLASEQGLPGCVDGSLFDMFQFWVNAMGYLQHQNPQDWQAYIFTENGDKQQILELCQQTPWIDLANP